MFKKMVAFTAMTLALYGCSTAESREYDIAPIFPLSENKCAEYHGEQSGDGFGASCLVTKAECERAVADWREAMQGLSDATQFSCE